MAQNCKLIKFLYFFQKAVNPVKNWRKNSACILELCSPETKCPQTVCHGVCPWSQCCHGDEESPCPWTQCCHGGDASPCPWSRSCHGLKLWGEKTGCVTDYSVLWQLRRPPGSQLQTLPGIARALLQNGGFCKGCITERGLHNSRKVP
jgi:hypothetical protein